MLSDMEGFTDDIEQLTRSEGLSISIMIGETKEGQLFCLIDRNKSTIEHVEDLQELQEQIEPLREILQAYTQAESEEDEY